MKNTKLALATIFALFLLLTNLSADAQNHRRHHGRHQRSVIIPIPRPLFISRTHSCRRDHGHIRRNHSCRRNNGYRNRGHRSNGRRY